jgi:NAD(P)-dependent dehydrogenase (short-subunit alcohol dehydrogenase family)
LTAVPDGRRTPFEVHRVPSGRDHYILLFEGVLMRVIITGADGALGGAVVQRFRQDATVAGLCGKRSQDDLEGLSFAAGDLADEGNSDDVVGRAVDRLGGLDAVVHLVGGFRWIEAASATVADWRDLFHANVETSVAITRAVLPRISDGGSICFVGAASAQPAGVGFGPYGGAKSTVARLTEALSAELRPRGVRVNAVLPSVIDTPQNRLDMPGAAFASWTSPAAIADTLYFLATPAAHAITGALIPVTNVG